MAQIDVRMPASSTDNGIPRFDGATGSKLQGAGPVIEDDGSLTMGAKKITGVLNGTAGSQDVATVKQMEDHVASIEQGLFWLDDVDAVAIRTGLPAYTAGANTITINAVGAFPAQDGVASALNKRYLVMMADGTGHIDHGVYKLTTLGDGGTQAVLTREPEMNSGDSASSRVVGADAGTSFGERTFRCKNAAGSDVVGTDALIFDDFSKTVDHGSTVGLGDDDHTQYALLAGRSGGQTFKGGTASGDDLILESTSHGTKGHIEVKDPILLPDQAGAAASTGRFQRNGADLSWHDGTAARVIEHSGRKDAASGYAGLDAGSKLNPGQLPTPASTQLEGAPGDGVEVVAGGQLWRHVYGMISVTATAGVAAKIDIAVETGVATGVFNTLQSVGIGAGVTSELRVPYSFIALKGRKYKFTKGGGVGVAETISFYSYTDF